MFSSIKQSLLKTILQIVLFAILVPGMIITLPDSGANKILSAIVHGVIYNIICMIISKFLFRKKKKA